MNKEFVPYEQALALKELGFDEPCLKVYQYGELISGPPKDLMNQQSVKEIYDGILAPLYQQAFRWLFEKRGVKGLVPLDDMADDVLKHNIELLKQQHGKEEKKEE